MKCTLRLAALAAALLAGRAGFAEGHAPHTVPPNRAASIYISERFINEQLAAHAKSELIRELAISLDDEHDTLVLHGSVHVPIEELRAVNLDPKLGVFRFQVALHPETTPQGHLILEFPLNETYFYPAASSNPGRDRVIVPVQMLSIALASARGYLAALSGDFGGFDRRVAKLNALLKSAERSMAAEKNPDAKEELRMQRESLRLQLAAVPIERKQLQALSKEIAAVLGFTGEKELNLNDDLAARDNALVLKLRLSQLTPYLKGVELGGIRIVHDKRDGGGQNYFVVNVNSDSAHAKTPSVRAPASRTGMKVAPDMVVRLRQTLLESDAVLSAEKSSMDSRLRDFDLQLRDDGMHVSGKWHTLIFFNIPFDTTIDFVTTGPDTFEARVRKMDVAGLDLQFLTGFVLDTLRKRLESTLKGICSFEYVGKSSDRSRALRVTVDPKALVPAFPGMHLVDLDIRERELLLKVGRVSPEAR